MQYLLYPANFKITMDYRQKIENIEKKRLYISIFISCVFLMVMWLIRVIEWSLNEDFYYLGVYPLKLYGLIGIITSPLIHANFSHIAANSVSLFVTLVIILYLYKEVAWKVIAYIWLITEFWVWIFARDAWHVGASGIIYGYITFLFFSGIIRRNLRLMAVSMLMVFLYGSLVWGIFPDFFPGKNISWESHLLGAIAGLIIAVYFRNYGMQREKYSWDFEEDEDDAVDEIPWKEE